MNKKMIFMILVFLVLSFVFSRTIFRRDFRLPEENGLFSQEVQEEIKKRVDPDREIYISAFSMYQDSFSIGFLAPAKNPDILKYWFAIYNNTEEYKKEHGDYPYQLYYSGNLQYIDLTEKRLLVDAFADLERIYNSRKEIQTVLSGESSDEEIWYDIRMNENGGNLDQYLLERVTVTGSDGKSTYTDEMVSANNWKDLEGIRYFILGETLEERSLEELHPDFDLFMVYEGILEETVQTIRLKGIIELVE